MGKGDNDRTGDKESFNKGYDKAFGKKKPWWEVRDEKKPKDKK